MNARNPCTGVCGNKAMKGGLYVCKSCYRSMSEIRNWHDMSTSDRIIAVSLAKTRRYLDGR